MKILLNWNDALTPATEIFRTNMAAIYWKLGIFDWIKHRDITNMATVLWRSNQMYLRTNFRQISSTNPYTT